MKIKVIDAIRMLDDEGASRIIGAIALSYAGVMSVEEALKQPFPSTLQAITREIEIDYKPTNADRIRAMNDEELAMNMMCPNENGLAEIECNKSDNCNCYECLLKWLQSEVEAE